MPWNAEITQNPGEVEVFVPGETKTIKLHLYGLDGISAYEGKGGDYLVLTAPGDGYAQIVGFSSEPASATTSISLPGTPPPGVADAGGPGRYVTFTHPDAGTWATDFDVTVKVEDTAERGEMLYGEITLYNAEGEIQAECPYELTVAEEDA